HSGSERDLHAAFERIFTNAPSRIVVANFASNIHRIQHLVRMATQFERRVAVVGRSLRENFRTARELGFLSVPDGVVVPLADVDSSSLTRSSRKRREWPRITWWWWRMAKRSSSTRIR